MRRVIRLTLVMALLSAGCGGETPPVQETVTTTTTTSTTTTTTSTTTTTTTLPSGEAIIGEGDRGVYVVALQTLLTCAGYGTLEADGVFGAKTAAAVRGAQGAIGKQQTGEPDEETFAAISRECDRAELLDLGGDGSMQVAGNVARDDDDRFTLGMQAGSVLVAEADSALSLRAEGEDGTSLGSADGRLAYESGAAQLVTVVVGAAAPTTYLLMIDLAPPEAGTGGTPPTAVEGDFDADDWIGMEWSGEPPGGLQDYQGTQSCLGLPSDSTCFDYYGTIVTRPGLFTASGADNPVEAMAWLLRNTGALVDDHAVWEIVDAEVFEAPIGDTVLSLCSLLDGDRPVVAYADIGRGTVTGALAWDWETEEISVIPPNGVQCVDGAGDLIAVGPGFG